MKKILVFFGIILIGALIWYLFIKPYDYLVTFKAKTFPGAIHQTIKLWGTNLVDSEIIGQEGIREISQRLKFGDSTHIYKWKIEPVNDSLSKVKVYVKDVEHSLNNKITIPFSDTNFEKRTKKTLLEFNKKLNEHISKFKVKIMGKEEFKSTYCAYIGVKTSQYGKAAGMMKHYPLLSTFLAENNVKLNGRPFLEVTHWDRNADSLEFNFCYPIIESDTLPQHPELKYKMLNGAESIKAEYNGNYITSDRAWYALMDYAQKNGLEVTGRPIEVFHNNPNMGGNELNWKTEIYMPLKKADE